MKSMVFVYASLIFLLTLLSGVVGYIVEFNLHQTLKHAYHRSMMATIRGELKDEKTIENNFSHHFLKYSPKKINYHFKVVDFQDSPKILRVYVKAAQKNHRLIYDETLIEEAIVEKD